MTIVNTVKTEMTKEGTVLLLRTYVLITPQHSPNVRFVHNTETAVPAESRGIRGPGLHVLKGPRSGASSRGIKKCVMFKKT